MARFSAGRRRLKHYPHFDQFLRPDKIEEIVRDPERVKTNKFYPFLLYTKHWQPFRPLGRPEKKRQIRYAARRDAYIFEHYREIISERYEETLAEFRISDSVIAYRKVLSRDGGGKCNIHFARDAFDRIRELEECTAVALDISSYFENIDHERLRAIWCRLLSTECLPADHATVFRNITGYAVVDRAAAYERLGFFGMTPKGGKGFLQPYNKIPMQLCSPSDFRKKIAGRDERYESLIAKNAKAYGIPQGAPISDILANIYLIDFDAEMGRFATATGGFYWRYSDDILIVFPSRRASGLNVRDHVVSAIRAYGDRLVIKPEKTAVVQYRPFNGHQICEHISGPQGRNGLEYLGFRYDGKRVFLRDSTVSGFYRRITICARHDAKSYVARYNGKPLDFLLQKFPYDQFISKFGRVENFHEGADFEDWTFWTYVRRSADAFGPVGQPILRQLAPHRSIIVERLQRFISEAHADALRREDLRAASYERSFAAA